LPSAHHSSKNKELCFAWFCRVIAKYWDPQTESVGKVDPSRKPSGAADLPRSFADKPDVWTTEDENKAMA